MQLQNLKNATHLELHARIRIAMDREPFVKSLMGGHNIYRESHSYVDTGGIDLKQLAEITLEDLSLLGAELDGANLSGANIVGTSMERVSLDGANLQGATLRNVGLITKEFSGADLTDADLENVDFKEPDFSGCNLRGTILRGADLTGATLPLNTFFHARGDHIRSLAHAEFKHNGSPVRGLAYDGEGKLVFEAPKPQSGIGKAFGVKADVRITDITTKDLQTFGLPADIIAEIEKARPAVLAGVAPEEHQPREPVQN